LLLQLPRAMALTIVLIFSSLTSFALADRAPGLDDYPQLLADFGSSDKDERSVAQAKWQNICFELGRADYDPLRAKACEKMCGSLASGQPRESALFLLRQLERIGRDETVATLQSQTASDDKVVADAARRALQNNRSESVHEALVTLLNSGNDAEFKVRIINSLAYRAEARSTSTLISQLENGVPQVQHAAAKALASLDSLPAAKAVFAAWENASGTHADQLAEAALVAANRIGKHGNKPESAAMFKAIYDGSVLPAVRASALTGQLVNAGDSAVQLMVRALNNDSVLEQQVAIGHASELKTEDVASLIKNLPKFPSRGQASLLFALGANRQKSALPAIEQACKSDDSGVKVAAITALGYVGSAAHTQLLLDELSGEEELRSAAKTSLSMIFDNDVDGLLLKRLATLDDENQRAEIISILSARRSPALAQLMVDTNALDSSNAATRKRANDILNRLGTVGHLPALITSMTKVPAEERDSIEKTVVNICNRIPSADDKAAPVAGMYTTAANELRPYLLSVAGRIGGQAAGEFIGSKIESSSAVEKDAAITAICNWPDDSVSDQLLTIAQSGDTAAQRRIAVRALARVIVLPSSRHSLDDQLAILNQTMKLATQDDERKLILDRVKAIGLSSAVEFVRAYFDTPTLGQQAEASFVHLARIRELRQADPHMRADLERILKKSADDKLRQRAQQFLTDY